MIMLTRLNGKSFYVNPDLIAFIEETPDTVITLTDGKKLVAVESAQRVISSIVEYRAKIFVNLPVRVLKDGSVPAPALEG